VADERLQALRQRRDESPADYQAWIAAHLRAGGRDPLPASVFYRGCYHDEVTRELCPSVEHGSSSSWDGQWAGRGATVLRVADDVPTPESCSACGRFGAPPVDEDGYPTDLGGVACETCGV
jgi:hypothetical protein